MNEERKHFKLWSTMSVRLWLSEFRDLNSLHRRQGGERDEFLRGTFPSIWILTSSHQKNHWDSTHVKDLSIDWLHLWIYTCVNWEWFKQAICVNQYWQTGNWKWSKFYSELRITPLSPLEHQQSLIPDNCPANGLTIGQHTMGHQQRDGAGAPVPTHHQVSHSSSRLCCFMRLGQPFESTAVDSVDWSWIRKRSPDQAFPLVQLKRGSDISVAKRLH